MVAQLPGARSREGAGRTRASIPSRSVGGRTYRGGGGGDGVAVGVLATAPAINADQARLLHHAGALRRTIGNVECQQALLQWAMQCDQRRRTLVRRCTPYHSLPPMTPNAACTSHRIAPVASEPLRHPVTNCTCPTCDCTVRTYASALRACERSWTSHVRPYACCGMSHAQEAIRHARVALVRTHSTVFPRRRQPTRAPG